MQNLFDSNGGDLCINQEDVEERTRQLRFMPHIYQRARHVIVWLNDTSMKCKQQQDYFVDSGPWLSEDALDICGEKTPSFLKSMIISAAKDPYWNRLWIVQEIGKASDIIVLIQHLAMRWTYFVKKVALWAKYYLGPFRLHAQLQRKYQGGHSLRNLLEEHQHALCKDPRDKIYGLVGLATDCPDFPVDYGKSRYEVWLDTMRVLLEMNSVLPSNAATFARFLRSLLGGNAIECLEPMVQPFTHSPLNQPSTDLPEVNITVTYLGIVLHVGPQLEDVVSQLREADSWHKSILTNIREATDDAVRENDQLLGAITGPDSIVVTKCLKLRLGDILLLRNMEGDLMRDGRLLLERSSDNEETMEQADSSLETTPWFQGTDQHTKLIQLIARPPKTGEPVCRLGVAASHIQLGDLIFSVRGTHMCVVLRQERTSHFCVIGTAAVTSNLSGRIYSPLDSSPSLSREVSGHEAAKISMRVSLPQLHALLT